MDDQWICFGEPEDAVCLFVPDPATIRSQHLSGDEGAVPYWAQIWPASLGLHRFLAAHPDFIRGKTVLELAAGLGLPSLYAARYANTILCSDYAPGAVDYCRRSAVKAGLRNFNTALLDWNDLPADLVADVVLLSDVNYEPAAFDSLSVVLERFLKAGTTILLSTPQRLMAKPFIAQWIPVCVKQEECYVTLNGTTSAVSVFVLSGSR
jgi:predicted nicotinamide N-methyase